MSEKWAVDISKAIKTYRGAFRLFKNGDIAGAYGQIENSVLYFEYGLKDVSHSTTKAYLLGITADARTIRDLLKDIKDGNRDESEVSFYEETDQKIEIVELSLMSFLDDEEE